MGPEVFGHALSDICEGVSEIRKGRSKRIPLKETRFTIDVNNGLATIKTLRTFVNVNENSIEALMTFPIPFDAVLTGLSADIDGRRLYSIAKAKSDARESYEEAVDQGKMAILHEEPLRGIHMLSIGQLGSKKKVSIEIEMVMALEDHSGTPFLRIPLTVGEIYGHSPLLPSDSLVTDPQFKIFGTLSVTERSGRSTFVSGKVVENETKISLSQSIELLFPNQSFGHIKGFDAWGRTVSINLMQTKNVDKKIDVAIMLDRSGSTFEFVGQNGKTIRTVIEEAVRNLIQKLNDNDRISIWEFDDKARLIVEGFAGEIRKNTLNFTEIANGTEIGKSIDTVVEHRPSAVIVLTDGQTYANEAQTAANLGHPISAVLVGPGSLDAMIGHLAASTGGQVFAAAEDDASNSLLNAVDGIRKGAIKLQGQVGSNRPQKTKTARNGTEIDISWDEKESMGQGDAIGRYAMALAMPLFDEQVATELAIMHGLVTHLTSLIIIDDVGEISNALPQTIKVPLPSAHLSHMSQCSSSSLSYDMGAISDRMMVAYSEKRASMIIASDESDLWDDNIASIHDSVGRVVQRNIVSIDWDIFASNLDQSEFDWPPTLMEFVEQLKVDKKIAELAKEIGISIKELAILYLAKRDQNTNRNAARAYRKILAEIDPKTKSLVEACLALIDAFSASEMQVYKLETNF